ncbi:MAG: PKD-like family lipoprotein [Bacteroidota bacterium]
MKIHQYIIALSFLAMAVSCSKDEGNYDYQPINEVNIQGLNTEYVVRTGIDTLRIQPKITATMDEGDTTRYNYYWIIKLGAFSFDTIGRKKDLVYPVKLNAVPWELFYRVVDKKTGVTWIANAKLNVSTPYSKGILIMGEDEAGYAEAEMLSMLKDTIHIKNLLSKSGLPRLRDPISFVHTGGSETYIKLWAFTKSGSYFLDRATLAGKESNNFSRTLFTSEPLDAEGLQPVVLAPQIITAAGGLGSTLYRAVITKGGDVFAGVPLLMGGDYFNNPINRLASAQQVRIPAAPYIFYPIASMSSIMWYDTRNNRFLNYTGIGSAVASTVLTDLATDAFPWNQPTGRTLVYAENTRNTDGGSTSGNSFAIMKDANNTHHIYKFYANGTNPAKRALYTIKSIATDFDKAKFYAFSSNRSVVFYAVGTRLYAYDYNPGFEKIYSFTETGGDEISMIKFDTQIAFATNSLYIATYNSATKGTLRRFKVGTNPNIVELTVEPNSTWKGMVKIKDINWRAVN